MGDLRQIRKHAHTLLDELGRSPDEVAASLEAAGVRGVPRSNSSCAIALYTAALMKADSRIRSVAVGPCSLVIDLARRTDSRPGGKLSVQLPKPVRGFVAGFDASRYPMVVRERTAPTDVPAPLDRR
ncbi:MAG: hypothetical protein ABSF84_03405 [Acidimicrobiales bacterium]|jgi:hypothetical protein